MRRGIGEIEIDFAANEIVHNHMLARRAKSKRALVFENVAGVLKFFQVAFVNVGALTLKIRTEIPADVRTFIPTNSEPFKSLINRGRGFFGIAFEIGVFDSQN